MPTISQLPLANGVSSSDELPLSQSGTTRSARLDVLLAGTQPMILAPTGSLLGRVSLGAGQPEIIAPGAGLALQGPALNATGADHVAFVPAGGLQPGDEVVINSQGQPKRMQAELLRALFSPGLGVTIGSDGTISAPGTAGPSGPQGVPGPAGSVSNATPLVSAQASDRIAISRGGSDGSVQLSALLASPVVATPGRTAATSVVALAARRFDPRDWGAVFDGAHDDAPAIQAALDAAAAAGGGVVHLPETQGGSVLIGSGLTIRTSGVRLEGPSPGGTADNLGDSVLGGLRLIWGGPTGGTMIRVAPVADPVNGRPLIGCGVTGVVLDCRSTAATGLAVLSVRRGEFEAGVVNSTGPGVLCDTVDLSEFNDVQDCIFDLTVSNIGTGGACVVLDGTSRGGAWVGNTSINRFRRMRLTYNAGDGLVVNNADSNHVEAVTGQHRPGFAAGSQLGNGRGVVLNGPTAGGVGASSNCFEYVSCDVHALAGSINNQVRWLDVGNGSPMPSIDPAATLYVSTSRIVSSDAASARVTIADNTSLAEAARAARGTEALRLQAASGDHARLVSGDGTVEWGLQVAPGGDLQVQSRKGTGQRVSIGTAALSAGGGVVLGDLGMAPSAPSSGVMLYSQSGQLRAVGPTGPVPIGSGGTSLPSGAALIGTAAGGAAQAITLGSGLTLTGTTLSVPGGPGYTLPSASVSMLGGVKVGTGLAVAGDGTLTATATSYTLPAATVSSLGGIKAGANTTIAGDGTLSVAAPFNPATLAAVARSGAYADLTGKPGLAAVATSGSYADLTNKPTIPPAYTLPAATGAVLGGVKQGSGISIAADGTLSATATSYILTPATASTLGGVKAGSGLSVAGDGTISVSTSYTLPAATTTVLGGVKVDGSTITATNGVISATAAGYATTITGDGAATSFTVTHNLGSTNVLVQVLDPANAGATVSTLEATRPTASTVVVPFSTAPASGTAFTVLVLKVA